MPSAMIVPLVLSAAVALLVGAAHRRLPPALATRTTTAALVVVAAAAVPTVWLTGATFLAHAPVTGRWLDSCIEPLSAHHPVSAWLGVPALVLTAVGLWRGTAVLRTHRAVQQTSGGVDVVDHDGLFAFTAPGGGGRIVVSSALHDRLSAQELAVVLAHERAHARHRHDRYLLTAQVAAALLAPLQPLVDRLRFSIERWADEDAVEEIGDRRLVARTLGRIALQSADHQPALAFAGLGVAARMEALLAPPVRRPGAAVRCALIVAIGVTAAFASFQVRHLADMLLSFCLG